MDITFDNDQVYDIETFPNLFTCTFMPLANRSRFIPFEISERRNQRQEFLRYLETLDLMIGFNNIGFDWPVINFMRDNPDAGVYEIYEFATEIIQTQRTSRFAYIIWNPRIPQLDLMRIHHFDNSTKATSLKTLQFNMRLRSIEDMPYPPGTYIPLDGIDDVLGYNKHDVWSTGKWYDHSLDEIQLRRDINPRWLNYSRTKLGTSYMIEELTKAGVQCYEEIDGKRRPRCTPCEDGVDLEDIILPGIKFNHPILSRLHDKILDLRVFANDPKGDTEKIKGDIASTYMYNYGGEGVVNVKFNFDLEQVPVTFGIGGIHGSVTRRKYTDGLILDLDVTSFYPSLAIVNRFYPMHLGEKYCDVYASLKETRLNTIKGTSANKGLKEALNATYGNSNSTFSPFFDPSYMLKTTINGQLQLLMLAEWLLEIPGLEIIQLNTDGLTVYHDDERYLHDIRKIAKLWEQETKLDLEEKRYCRLFIRDVNNYIGEFEDGGKKRKGAYEYEREWYQNHSGLVIPKAAERALLYNEDAEAFLMMHEDMFDFMYRVKTGDGSYVEFDDGTQMRGTIRYYLSRKGQTATKIMPKTHSRIHANAYSEPEGSRGNWRCPECDFSSNRKVDVQKHLQDCHSSRIAVCQVYDGEGLDLDLRPYLLAVNKLIEGFE